MPIIIIIEAIIIMADVSEEDPVNTAVDALIKDIAVTLALCDEGMCAIAVLFYRPGRDILSRISYQRENMRSYKLNVHSLSAYVKFMIRHGGGEAFRTVNEYKLMDVTHKWAVVNLNIMRGVLASIDVLLDDDTYPRVIKAGHVGVDERVFELQCLNCVFQLAKKLNEMITAYATTFHPLSRTVNPPEFSTEIAAVSEVRENKSKAELWTAIGRVADKVAMTHEMLNRTTRESMH